MKFKENQTDQNGSIKTLQEMQEFPPLTRVQTWMWNFNSVQFKIIQCSQLSILINKQTRKLGCKGQTIFRFYDEYKYVYTHKTNVTYVQSVFG